MRIIIISLLLLSFSVTLFSQVPENNGRNNTLEDLKTGAAIEVPSCNLIDSIIDFAMTKKGCPYQYAHAGPQSFDCSGFTSYVFKHFGITLARSSKDQYTIGQKIKNDELRKGDLVFFSRGKQYVGHVGLVVSVDSLHNFTFIHASTYRTGVRIDHYVKGSSRRAFVGARRIIDCEDVGGIPIVADSADTLVPEVRTDTIISPPTAVVKPITPAPPSFFYHKIKKGETLSHIAAKYHTTVAKLKKWNHLRSDFIREGQKLKIYK